MKDLVLTMAKALVNDPSKVKVKELRGQGTGVIFQITAEKDDYRFLIGKKGRIIEAVRSIVNAASFKVGAKCLVEIMDDRDMRGKEKEKE